MGGGGVELEAVYVRYERGNSLLQVLQKRFLNDEIIIKQKTSNDPLVIQHNLCLHLHWVLETFHGTVSSFNQGYLY